MQQAEHCRREKARVDRESNDERLSGAGVQADATAERAAQVEVGHVIQSLTNRGRLEQDRDVVAHVVHAAEDFGQLAALVEAFVQTNGDGCASGRPALGARELGAHLVDADHLFHATGEHALVGRGQQVDLVDLTEVGPKRIVAAVVFVGQGLGEHDVRGEPESVLLEQDRRDRISGLRGQMHRRQLLGCSMGTPAANGARVGLRRVWVANG